MNVEMNKKKFLGYKGMLKPVEYEGFLSECVDIILDKSMPSFDDIYTSMDEVKAEVKAFYEKHFKIHEVYSMEYTNNQMPVAVEIPISETLTDTKLVEGYYKFLKNCKKVSPYDLPVVRKEGFSLEGDVSKAVYPISPTLLPPFVNRVAPFFRIVIGGGLSEASAATYAHELMHTQIESRIGYAEDYCKKETLPVFIEKVYALEKDPSGELLRKVNKIKIGYDLKCLTVPLTTGEFGEEGCHAVGGLLALALFDKYLNEQQEESRLEYFADIQKVMDGKMTVDALLDKRGIDAKTALNVALVKKYA